MLRTIIGIPGVLAIAVAGPSGGEGAFITAPVSNINLWCNRLAKSGSATMVMLAQELSNPNGFHAMAGPEGRFSNCDDFPLLGVPRPAKCTNYNYTHDAEVFVSQRIRPRRGQRALVCGHGLFLRPISASALPWVFFNVARDPVTQYRSRYNYIRVGGRFSVLLDAEAERRGECGCPAALSFEDCVVKGMAMAGRCGPEKSPLWAGNFLVSMLCNASDPAAGCQEQWYKLTQQQHIEHSAGVVRGGFAFIGLLEHMQQTLEMLEYLFPECFSGATACGVSRHNAAAIDVPLPVGARQAIEGWPANRMDVAVCREIERLFWASVNATDAARAVSAGHVCHPCGP